MGRRVDSALWDQRRELVQKQLRSGLSVGEFCRENALNLNNFQAWKRRLKRTDQDDKLSTQQPSRIKLLRGNTESIGHPAFVQIPTSTVASSSWIEVSLSEGIVVRVPSTNLAALRMVLGVLKPASEVSHV
jgi:transposase-like protein